MSKRIETESRPAKTMLAGPTLAALMLAVGAATLAVSGGAATAQIAAPPPAPEAPSTPEAPSSESQAEQLQRELGRIFGRPSDESLDGLETGETLGDDALGDGGDEKAAKLTPEEALEQAYEDLRSDEEAIWRAAEARITKSWSQSGSDSMDLLLERGRAAMQREDWAAAQEHLTDLVNLAPDFAEGWNVRASAHFYQENVGAALADLAHSIAHEPRHFSAYAGLGVIFEQLSDPARALAAHRAALEIHPHLEASLSAVKRLSPSADGRPI